MNQKICPEDRDILTAVKTLLLQGACIQHVVTALLL